MTAPLTMSIEHRAGRAACVQNYRPSREKGKITATVRTNSELEKGTKNVLPQSFVLSQAHFLYTFLLSP